MKTVKYLSYLVLGTFVLAFTSCEPKALKPEDVFKTTDDASLAQMLQEENPQVEKNLENSNSNINNLNIQNLESNSGSFLINVQTLE